MIQEDYVNFECAKLLKEKGFDEICNWYYKINKYLIYIPNVVCSVAYSSLAARGQELFPRPTLQMAMKWLREVHNWHISVTRGPQGYHISIITVPFGIVKFITVEITGNRYVESYEEAVQAAIIYCLNNLI